MLENFISENNNQIVSFDNVPSNAGQVPQLLAKWCTYVGLPFQWANAADWWDDSDDTFLEHWDKVVNDRKDGEQLPRAGDIIIFDSSLPGSGGYGAASIFIDSVGPNSWRGFTANWGGKSAHVQSHNWSYVLGWFSPKNHSVVEDHNPTPIADEAPSSGYELQEFEPRSVTVRNDAAIYDMDNVDWESFQQNVVGQVKENQDLIVAGIARHRLGGSYYVLDLNRAAGVRVVDCDNHNGDGEKVVDPEEKLRKPKLKKRFFPEAPLLAPIKDTITTKKDIPRYASMGDASNNANSNGIVPAGTYYPYRYLNGMTCLSKELGVALGWWINPDDLLSDSEKLRMNWRGTYRPFRDQYGNIAPRYYRALNDDIVPDLETKHRDLTISRRQPILIRGWFLAPDGIAYGRPDAAVQKELMWYGVRRDNLEVLTDEVTDDEDDPLEVDQEIAEDPPTLTHRLVSVLPNGASRVFDIIRTKL